MTNQLDVQITLSLDEFKDLIHEAVKDVLLEVLGEDQNTEPCFTSEIAERLQRYRTQKPAGIPIDDVAKELHLDN